MPYHLHNILHVLQLHQSKDKARILPEIGVLHSSFFSETRQTELFNELVMVSEKKQQHGSASG